MKTDDDRSRYNKWRQDQEKKGSKGRNQIQSTLGLRQRRTGNVTTLNIEEVDQDMKGA